MALQKPSFNLSARQFAPSATGLATGIRDFAMANRQQRAADEQRQFIREQQAEKHSLLQQQQEESQRIRREGAMQVEILQQKDPASRARLMAEFAKNSPELFQQELAALGQLPIEDQDSVIRASLIEDNLQGLIPKQVADENLLTIQKETRAALRKDLGAISKEASIITTNFNKIQGLIGEVETGNRSSTGQALVAMVKLGDPGSTVREEEAKTALNRENPVAAVTAMLVKNNTPSDVVDAIVGSLDPLNPANIKVDEFMRTANALVDANVPSIQNRFSTAKELADENLTGRGIKSLFTKGLEKSVSDLSGLGHSWIRRQFDQLPPEEQQKFRSKATPEELRELGIQ